ncbi:hypothetical protein EB093_04725 [bacterium]|nr:hypothetical protein [bacterium]
MFSDSSQFNIGDRMGWAFSEFFGVIYPYVHNHFVSYSLILVIALGIVWVSFKRLKRSRSLGEKLIWGILIAVTGSFAAWMVLFHFHTFLTADMYFEER